MQKRRQMVFAPGLGLVGGECIVNRLALTWAVARLNVQLERHDRSPRQGSVKVWLIRVHGSKLSSTPSKQPPTRPVAGGCQRPVHAGGR
jgi:hypothetical protein